MKLRSTIASSIIVLAVLGVMVAQEMSQRAGASDQPPTTLHGVGGKPMGDTIVQVAAVTEQVAQLASLVEVVGPPAPAARPTVAPAAAPPKPLAVRAPHPAAMVGVSARSEHVAGDATPMLVRCVGKPETGRAAWYGGHYIGQRTSSGDRLDTIRPTAAHRTLPLNSLARVTNLQNGRSVIVKVTDRGPVSTSLLIDMSPRAAEQLAMVDAGVVPVRVEQVVEVPPDTK